MKIKLDENLPLQIAAELAAFGHDVHTVFEEKLTGSKDPQIWAAAQSEQRLLLTQDLISQTCASLFQEHITEYFSSGCILPAARI
jgi:predicted nuclease of predicted toxin-antitoxin system